MNSFIRIIKHALTDFRRNFWLSVITISIIAVSFLSINILFLINVLAETTVEAVESKVDVSVFFNPETSENIIFEVRSKLLTIPEVAEIQYISPDQALEKFKQTHQDDPDIMASLEELEENPLGASLIIQAESTKDYSGVLNILNDPKYKDFIVDKNFDEHEMIISRVSQLNDQAQKVGWFLTAVFIVISFVIVFNTIKVAIHIHRDELGIMRLVGASSWFIRAPFLIESVFFCIFGLLASILILYPLLIIMQPYVDVFLQSYSFDLVNYFVYNTGGVIVLELAVMIILSVISSYAASRRYLRI